MFKNLRNDTFIRCEKIEKELKKEISHWNNR